MAQQIAKSVNDFQHKRTGHAPGSVTVVIGGDTVVITLHDALTPAEQETAKSPAGVAQVQEYHRQLFASNARSLREEITRITGVAVREATAKVEPATGTVIHALTSDTRVQVFQMSHAIASGSWSG